jgi:hypothetical protein
MRNLPLAVAIGIAALLVGGPTSAVVAVVLLVPVAAVFTA